MPKQGTTFSLAVDFTGLDLDKAERIEFIFRRGPTNASPLIKRCSWPGEAVREEGGRRILVPWAAAETWLVPGDGTFYLDTRITLRDSTDQPQTEILALKMSPTLFQEVDGA